MERDGVLDPYVPANCEEKEKPGSAYSIQFFLAILLKTAADQKSHFYPTKLILVLFILLFSLKFKVLLISFPFFFLFFLKITTREFYLTKKFN